MPKFRIEKDGQVFEVDVAAGQDPNAALSEFLGRQEQPRGFEDALPGVILPEFPAEEAKRGLGLGARSVVGAVPKAAAGLTDIGASVLNLIPAAISKADVALGGEPLDARLPTGAVQNVDEFLNRFFPEPETFGEKVVVGGGEIALIGGAGGAALAPKAGQVVQGGRSVARGIGDLIGEFFTKSPKTFAATELGGGAGAVAGGEVAEEADTGPLGTFIAQLLGGVAGGVGPQGVMNLSRRAATGIANFGAGSGATRRAAQTLQEAAGDPATAARTAREAPEGVLPARATDEPGLKALESKVLADDPALEARVARDLEVAERQNLETLADDFGPGTSRQEWQNRVVQETAPEGVVIAQRQPDEMLSQSFRAFKGAYDVAKGHTITTRIATREGNISAPEGLLNAVFDPAVLTGAEVRTRVARWLQGRYESTVRRGTRTGGTDDSPIIELTSDDLLELRHVIRTQQRAKAKTGQTSADAAAEAELLANADAGLTETINAQLPPDASAALRATDAKYANFKTVSRAIRRSGEKGLTETGLRSSIASRTSEDQFARGETGRLGELTEQGANVARIIRASDVEAAERMVRTMNPTELRAAKGDFVNELTKKATRKFQGASRLKGEDLLNELAKSRKVFKAAGFNDADFNRIETIGRQLKTIQGKSASAVTELLTDNVGRTMRLIAAIAGSRAGTRALKLLGGTTGAGPSLILAQFGSREMQKQLSRLTVDKADALIRGAIDDKNLFAALLVTPTDVIPKQAAAARTIQAWLISAGAEAADNTTADEEE